MVKVTFLPMEKTVEVPEGIKILDAAVLAGVEVESTCGGRGTCGKCKVLKRPLDCPEKTPEAVLACQEKITEDTLIILMEKREVTDRKINLNSAQEFRLKAGIKKLHLLVPRPSLHNPCPDWERLGQLLPFKEIGFHRKVAASLPQILRQQKHEVTVVLHGNSILAVEPGDTSSRAFGIAVDLGTTTVVAYLVDLIQGKVLAGRATTNPQNIFGADVISRIAYASQGPDRLEELQKKIVAALNWLISQLCAECFVSSEEIYQAVVVGNTTMAHLFLGIDPRYLASFPFTPVFRQEVEVEAGELGLAILSTGKVIVLPNIAGYVGSDTVGVMLAVGVDNLEGVNLIVDIGTNGEIILVGKGKLLTCSTAAGPAFEGGEIKCGMRAAAGAIEGVRIHENVELDIIGNERPQGICGSGLIDAVAEMVRMGIIDSSGSFQLKSDNLEKLPFGVKERVRINNEGGAEFVLVWASDCSIGEDIVITQKDIRKLQLAKGAIAVGIKILLKELGVKVKDIERVFLAGAFGNYIKKESALMLGLLPPVEPEKISAIGNAAGEGAKMALLSPDERFRAKVLARKTRHVELSVHKDFQEEFLKSFSFGNQI